jgi:hypothetical protein
VTPLPAGAHRKPRADLYTALLVIALVAILIGILFLYLEMDLYEFKLQGAPPVGMVDPSPTASGHWLVANGQCSTDRLSLMAERVPRS